MANKNEISCSTLAMELSQEDKFKNAARIKQSVPNSGFTVLMALFCAGFTEKDARSQTIQRKVKRICISIQQDGSISFISGHFLQDHTNPVELKQRTKEIKNNLRARIKILLSCAEFVPASIQKKNCVIL